MKNKKFGQCKICGKKTHLTFEHIPPKVAYNKQSVYIIGPETSNKSKKYRKISQKGVGDYYLCRKCNNYNGLHYVKEYSKVARLIGQIIFEDEFYTKEHVEIKAKQLNLIAFFKQVISIMVCTTNFNIAEKYGFNTYLQDKDCLDIDTTLFDLELYVISPSAVYAQTGLTVSFRINEKQENVSIQFAEFSHFPIGIILNFSPEHPLNYGVKVNHLFDTENSTQNIKLKLPFKSNAFVNLENLYEKN